jgi:periplasmic protein TonB
MFERLHASHTSRLDPRDSALAAFSLLLHAFAAGGAILASCLAIPEVSLPRLRPVLLTPVIFPRAGALAPRLGSHISAPPLPVAARPRPPRNEAVVQPREVPPLPPEPPASPPSPAGDAGPALGPGEPDGEPDGDPNGKKGARCVGEGCDPDGPVGPGPGVRGSPGPDAPPAIHRPGLLDVTAPILIESSKILPRYPELPRRAGMTGRVILEAVIRTDGTVASVSILREDPPGLGFAEAAANAVARWRYRPGTQYGVPVEVYFTVTVDFDLTR